MVDDPRKSDPAPFRPEAVFSEWQRRGVGFLLHQGLADYDLAHDIVSSVFTKLLELSRSNPQHPISVEYFISACKNMALNERRDRINRERLRRLHLDSSSVINPVEVELEARQRAIDTCLGSLSADHREILRLRFVEDLSYEGIGEFLAVSQGTVASRINRAVAALRNAVGDNPSLGTFLRDHQ